MIDRELGLDEDFRAAMGDVIPHKPGLRAALKTAPSSEINHEARRRFAVDEVLVEKSPFSENHIESVAPDAILEYKRPGVQNGVYRNLRLGKYSLDARLDLHNHTVSQARSALTGFIRDCLAMDIRCALITHGTGAGRKNPAVIKSCLASWLPLLDEVLAFHSAQRHHGGSGATYLLMKKSLKKRQENLERHQKRS